VTAGSEDRRHENESRLPDSYGSFEAARYVHNA